MAGNVHSQQETLAAKQETFILAMPSEPTIADAAKVTGISEKTAHRWLKLPQVKMALQKAQDEVYQAGLLALKLAVADAAKTLHHHAISDGTPPGIQVRASEIIVKQAIELQQKHELEARMAALEARIQEHSS